MFALIWWFGFNLFGLHFGVSFALGLRYFGVCLCFFLLVVCWFVFQVVAFGVLCVGFGVAVIVVLELLDCHLVRGWYNIVSILGTGLYL